MISQPLPGRNAQIAESGYFCGFIKFTGVMTFRLLKVLDKNFVNIYGSEIYLKIKNKR